MVSGVKLRTVHLAFAQLNTLALDISCSIWYGNRVSCLSVKILCVQLNTRVNLITGVTALVLSLLVSSFMRRSKCPRLDSNLLPTSYEPTCLDHYTKRADWWMR